MSRYYDEDGLDGPFERAMARAMKRDEERARQRGTVSTGRSSEVYGACEVCGRWCAEVSIRSVANTCVLGHRECVERDPDLVFRAHQVFWQFRHYDGIAGAELATRMQQFLADAAEVTP